MTTKTIRVIRNDCTSGELAADIVTILRNLPDEARHAVWYCIASEASKLGLPTQFDET